MVKLHTTPMAGHLCQVAEQRSAKHRRGGILSGTHCTTHFTEIDTNVERILDRLCNPCSVRFRVNLQGGQGQGQLRSCLHKSCPWTMLKGHDLQSVLVAVVIYRVRQVELRL